MDKKIFALVNEFTLWKGNSFTLASLIVEAQKEVCRERLIEAGFTEAAEVI